MYNGQTVLGIIPARSGSKELPHKNIRPFAGKPLMAWTILAARESGVIDEVFVSTDSAEYAAVARQYGANVPFLRPGELSGDACPVGDCAIHAISEYRSRLNRAFDYFALLQPTSPLRTAEHIADGIHVAVDGGYSSVVSFSPLKTDPRLICELPFNMKLSDISSPMFGPPFSRSPAQTQAQAASGPHPRRAPHASPNNTLRQDADQLYVVNGMLYISKCDVYESTGSFYGAGGRAIIIDNLYAIDIDDEVDFLYAEFLAQRLGLTGVSKRPHTGEKAG